MTTHSGRIDPVAGPVPPPGLSRSAWKLRHKVRALLGIRRSFKVDGVYFKETSPELLWRALSRKGSGRKQFRVTFPDKSKMLINCTPDRVYADAVGPLFLPQYRRAAPFIRPGMRVLDIFCGTGYGAAWLSRQVGPSGAVVAIDPDPESIAFAQKRYGEGAPGPAANGGARGAAQQTSRPGPNIAFEIGDLGALRGETDGSFDAVFSVACLHLTPDDAGLLTEAWRVVAADGWLLVAAQSAPATPTPASAGPSGAPARRYDRSSLLDLLARAVSTAPGPAPRPEMLSAPNDDVHAAMVRKPAG